jgi:hypothetical protein
MEYENVTAGGLRTCSFRAVVFAFCWCALIVGSVYAWYRFTPHGSIAFPTAALPRVVCDEQGPALQSPTGILAADVATFDDQFSAFLYFDYMRSREITSGMKFLLTLAPSGTGPHYLVRMVLADELVTAVPYLADLEAKGFIGEFHMRFLPASVLDYEQRQTAMFVKEYSRDDVQRLEAVPPEQLVEPVARFLLFKSQTDPRVRVRNMPGPERLTVDEARTFAADMIAVSRFYDVPLDLLLGVGAMENNYMHWAGDLRHSVWKRSPDPGDIVLRRARHRVLVRNYALGAWQITRETLRRVHESYLKDKETRDYSLLPPELRPQDDLDPDTVSLRVLTTYAGLLLRNLLDQKNGDLQLAAGAYNGGLRHPNLQYAAGVWAVGDYARRVVQREMVLRSRPPLNMRFLTARRSLSVPTVAVSVPSAGHQD